MIDVSLLLELIQQYGFLYDKSLKDFKDIAKKNNAWVEMAETLNCGVDEVKSRWRTLRERYTKEVKGSQPKSGQGSSENSTWEWFESMQFLEKHVKPRKTVASAILSEEGEANTSAFQRSQDLMNLINDEEVDDSTPSGSSVEVTFTSPRPSLTNQNKKRKRQQTNTSAPNANKQIHEEILSTINELRSVEDKSEDEDDLFCRSVARELRKVKDEDEKQKRKARIYLIATGLENYFANS